MDNLKIFEDRKIRSHWDAAKELWYFSLKKEGSELATNCSQLKMRST
jgi:hypothetical protein